MNNTLVDIMNTAAKDVSEAADYNATPRGSIRASSAGLPLIQLVLKDCIYPKLPKIPAKYKTDPFSQMMSLATGHLFEKAVEAKLMEEFPTWTLEKQLELNYKGLTGHADIILVNHELKKVHVIECKALKVSSVSEVIAHKLRTDNWGYLTQLCLYTAAVYERYPDYQVCPMWYVWMKPVAKHTVRTLGLRQDEVIAVADAAVERSMHFAECKRLFEAKQLDDFVDYVFRHTTALPQKIFTNGYYASTCDVHFIPYTQVLIDNEGEFTAQSKTMFRKLAEAAMEQDEQKALDIQKLIR